LSHGKNARIHLLGLAALVAVVSVVGCGPSPYQKDVEVVARYFRSSSTEQPLFFSAGSLQGGTAVLAVLAPGDAAFWVKDGKVYVVNDAARKVAPELEQAPESIKYDQAFVDAAHTGE